MAQAEGGAERGEEGAEMDEGKEEVGAEMEGRERGRGKKKREFYTEVRYYPLRRGVGTCIILILYLTTPTDGALQH